MIRALNSRPDERVTITRLLPVQRVVACLLFAASAAACGGNDATGPGDNELPADHLAFVTGPSDVAGQEPISPAIEVAVLDSTGSRVADGPDSVTVVVASDPTTRDSLGGGTSLSGTTTVSVSNGIANFSDVSVTRPGNGFTLKAFANGLTPDTSAAFDVHLNFVQVSAGDTHSCGVTQRSHVFCWGTDRSGGLGDGEASSTPRSRPVAADVSQIPVSTFRQVSVGTQLTCAVTTTDKPYCWGFNASGEIGDGSTTDRARPTPVDVSSLATPTFFQITAGVNHACGVTTADELFCWGNNDKGQLGDGTTVDRSTPVAVDVSGLPTTTFDEVSAGDHHTCAVTTADEVYCWGRNRDGALGDGTTTDRSTPVAVDVSELSTPTFQEVSAGDRHTCGVTTAGEPACWGNNTDGQLGNDSTSGDQLTPVLVDVSGLSTQTFSQVHVGSHHTCGITTSDEAYCWGFNDTGQLGDGTTNDRSAPVPVDVSGLSPPTFMSISGGFYHTCGVTTGSEAFCWGKNTEGQLGDGTNTGGWTPLRVIQ